MQKVKVSPTERLATLRGRKVRVSFLHCGLRYEGVTVVNGPFVVIEGTQCDMRNGCLPVAHSFQFSAKIVLSGEVWLTDEEN